MRFRYVRLPVVRRYEIGRAHVAPERRVKRVAIVARDAPPFHQTLVHDAVARYMLYPARRRGEGFVAELTVQSRVD